MECRYCGFRGAIDPINICICGRSGSWDKRYQPNLLDCSVEELGPPLFLKFLRQRYYQRYPANAAIIEDALKRAHGEGTDD